MKKIVAIITAFLVLAVSLTISIYNDSKFNPVGNWLNTDDIVLDKDGNELIHLTTDDMRYKNFIYTFNKSGTGYMTVDGDKTYDFTYDYNEKNVTIKDMTTKIFQDGHPVETHSDDTFNYKVSDNGTKLTFISDTITADGVTVYEKTIFVKQ